MDNRQIEVDNNSDLLDVNTTRTNISGYQDFLSSLAEPGV